MNQRRVGISSLMSPPPSYNSRGSVGQHRTTTTTDENLDLFSRNRRIFNSYFSDESDSSSSAAAAAAAVSMKLGRLSVASVKLSRSGIDDLFNNSNNNNIYDDGQVGKHDYDWLLTPPGTPLVSSSDANEPRSAAAGPRRTMSVRSASTTKASRFLVMALCKDMLSVAQPENNYSSRPTRSSSVTRSSISTINYTSFSANKSPSTILNTSSQFSFILATFFRKTFPPPTSRPSTPGDRTSRPSTPSTSRTITTTNTVAKPLTPQNSRPSTPTSRTQTSTNTNSLTAPSNSRRNAAPASVGPPLTDSRSSSVASRGSSPAPLTRTTHQPILLPDFPLDTPPNLRTIMPDRPVSAGRSRLGAGLAASKKVEASGPVNPNPPWRQSPSPKVSPNSEADNRRPLKPATSMDSTGFGRTISKKSIDMALIHVSDSSAVLGVLDSYPPRSTSSNNGRTPGHSNAPSMSDNGNILLLKGDLKNTNWLQTMDDKSELFDQPFEPLSEPFDPL
ncbi:hypothetical protein MKX03_025936 [Papaver bracteatum]|nr:hypothetical protein MKX03_025936 [Papaver bracteatum]